MVICLLVKENLDRLINLYFYKMGELDRADIIDKTNYQFNMSGEQSSASSKKSWWVIGLLIGFGMNFLAFLIFYMYHKNQHSKRVMY